MTPASECFLYQVDCSWTVSLWFCTWRHLLRHLRLPLQCCNLWCCTQDGGTTATLLVADSANHVVQHIEAAERLDNRQPLQPPGCIIISDSEGEADVSGHAAAVAPPSTSIPLSSFYGPIRSLVEHNCKSAVCTTAHRSSSCESETQTPTGAVTGQRQRFHQQCSQPYQSA